MKQFETTVQYLKHRVLTEVIKSVYKGDLKKDLLDIPKKIIPGPKAEMRCCIYKEREIISERIKLALGGEKKNNNLLEVLEAACEECPFGGVQITPSCRGCLAHRCLEACPKKAISIDNKTRQAVINKELCINCGLCIKACQFSAIANFTRPCASSCKVGAITSREDGICQIIEEKCTRCGACSLACPYGAIMDKSFILDCIKLLQDQKRKGHIYFVVAPSIATQYPNIKVGQIVSGIKKLGVSKVFEAALGADMVAYNEARDLEKEGVCTSSCCSAFVKYIKTAYPELVDKISKNLSPMATMCKYIKREDKDATCIFVGPCIAKKMEVTNKESSLYVDNVITFEELDAFFDALEIDLASLKEDKYENASFFGRVFGRSGGLSIAVKQALSEKGSSFELKECFASGLDQCKNALNQLKAGTNTFNFLEGMACTGGCIFGPASLSHKIRDTSTMDKYAKESDKKGIEDSLKNKNGIDKISNF